jgi:nitroreductase
MTQEPVWRNATELAPCADWACALIEARQTILPKRLVAPGPDSAQVQQILSAAAAAPDHGERLPWRFVVVPVAARERLAEVFACSLLERDADATPQQVAQAREKAHRAPLLLLAIARLTPAGGADDIPDDERLLSAGCAIQNMLLAATAQGFASALTSGKALQSAALRALFGLQVEERALCFMSVGTATARRPRRARPLPDAYVSVLGERA